MQQFQGTLHHDRTAGGILLVACHPSRPSNPALVLTHPSSPALVLKHPSNVIVEYIPNLV